MDKRIFKKCPTLGEYHGMALPYVKSQSEYREFYNQHKEMIDMEAKIYWRYSIRKDGKHDKQGAVVLP